MESFYLILSNLGYTHPIHPTMVYLPIGGIMAALIFGITAVLLQRSSLLTSAKHCSTLALIALLPTIIFGYMDWQHFLGGQWIFPIRMKMILAALLLVLLFSSTMYQWRPGANTKVILALCALCFLNVAALGFYGGEIVFAGFAEKNRGLETAGEAQGQAADTTITYAEASDILNQNCIICHKGKAAPLGLQLDTYEHVMEGSRNGKVIVPGKPEESELVRRIKGLSEPAMPFMQAALPGNKIETIMAWIQQGAKGDISPDIGPTNN
jgi:uncharacterized membrane protein